MPDSPASLFLRRGEELFGQREFYGPTVFHEERVIRKAPGLGQVVRDDDDAAGLAQLLQRLLYLQGIADVQGRAGFIEEQDLGPYSQAASNAEALLLAQKKKGKRNKNVSSEELLPYRQIFDIPPYLLKHVFFRGHRILPVNEEQDNIICANASEAATLALCGVGYVLLPDYLLPAHKELTVFPWPESPATQLGIYSQKTALSDTKSTVCQVIREAQAYYADSADD